MISWLNGDAAEAQRHDDGAEGEAAAQDAPVDRPPLAGLQPHEHRAA